MVNHLPAASHAIALDTEDDANTSVGQPVRDRARNFGEAAEDDAAEDVVVFGGKQNSAVPASQPLKPHHGVFSLTSLFDKGRGKPQRLLFRPYRAME